MWSNGSGDMGVFDESYKFPYEAKDRLKEELNRHRKFVDSTGFSWESRADSDYSAGQVLMYCNEVQPNGEITPTKEVASAYYLKVVKVGEDSVYTKKEIEDCIIEAVRKLK